MSSGSCLGGWGAPMAEYYTLAWLDRWLKQPGEAGYADADARLLDDAGEHGCQKFSFYSRSARSFTDRGGKAHLSEDLREDCLAGKVDSAAAVTPVTTAAPTPTETPTARADAGRFGGAVLLPGLLLVVLGGWLARLRRRF